MLLNPKQEAFCLHFAKTGNAAEAYRQAGYKCANSATAAACGRRMLNRANIQKRLKELADEAASAKIAGISEVQERLTSILRGELLEEQVVVEGCGDGVSEARIVKRAAQLKDRIKAGELLARMQGGLDGSNVNVTVTVPVIGGEEGLED